MNDNRELDMKESGANEVVRSVLSAGPNVIYSLLWLLVLGGFTLTRAQCLARPERAAQLAPANTSTSSPPATGRTPDIIALTTDNRLLRFNSAEPGKILSELSISQGNLHGESIVAIDYSSSDGYLYALSNAGRLYRIYENGIPEASGNLRFSNQGTKIGFDVDPKRSSTMLPFDPFRKVIRVVNDAGQNQLMAPDYGLLSTATQNLAYADGDRNAGRKPNIVGLAYSNNFPDFGSTTAYGIDSEQDSLVRFGSILGNPTSPDTGQLFTIGLLGVNTSSFVGFDIGNGSNTAYASLTSPSETLSRLYTVDLTTGAATLIGDIGSGRLILDLAVAPVGYLTWNVISPVMYCWTIIPEGDVIRFSVSRWGDTSVATTVDYAPDISTNAQEGYGFVGMTGRIYFAPGERTRTFTIFLTSDAAIHGGYLVIRLIKPTGGFVPYGPDYFELEVGIGIPDPGPNPIDDAHIFLREQYIDFLNREPDSAGLQFWQNQLNSCGSDQQCVLRQRINVSAAFFLSIEFQETGYWVYRFYKASFGRMPQLTEFLPDKQVISQDVIVNSAGWEQQLEKNKIAFADFWMDRPDFKNSYDDKTNAQYVDALIANAGVAFSQAGRDALVNGLDNFTETRASVLRKIAENQTLAQQEFNRAFVLMQYFGYLRRNPNDAPDSDFSGYNFWLTKLNQFNGDFQKAEMVKAFITSVEYRSRFGQP